jgi:hypothetical protein
MIVREILSRPEKHPSLSDEENQRRASTLTEKPLHSAGSYLEPIYTLIEGSLEIAPILLQPTTMRSEDPLGQIGNF